MRISVDLHADDHGMPAPRALHFRGRQVDVVEVLDQWYGPDYRYVKVRGRDEALYILRLDEARTDWELTMFKRAQAPRGGPSRVPSRVS